MPDYNPAVATGIAPQGNALSGTFDTIMNLQRTQAQTGLIQLQQALQQRKLNGLAAATQAYQAGEDPVVAGLRAGLDPQDAAQFQNLGGTRTFMNAHGGLLPQGAEANANIALRGAETANARAELGGHLAETSIKQRADAAQAAQHYLANPTDENWNTDIVGHAQQYYQGTNGLDTASGIKALRNIPTAQRDQVARAALAGGMPTAEATKPQAISPESNVTTPLAQAGGQAPTALGSNAPNTPQSVEQAKQQGGYFSKLYSGISALGNTSAASLEDIRLAKAAINDPNFWSGTGETYNLMYKRALALGGNTSAVPQEVFKKVMAANVLQQTNGMKAAAEEMGASSSRLFQSQIELMEKAAQNPENTIQSNRFLTELAERTANKNIKLADSAADYKNGKLDPQFEKGFRKDASAPMFSNWEMGHLETIGAPAAEKLKAVDPREIAHLKANPKNADKFDAYYGPGTAKAAMAQ